ncbi:MAG: hypothetical protein EON93_14675 [Burkholderiales bacterium]|nr:MAG: hypothetical protein EON93_14675 [Burkholderiales bacterium]
MLIARRVFPAAALISAAAFATCSMAQIALPTNAPASPSNPIQDGAIVQLGQTAAGNLAVKADGGRQAPAQALVSPDRSGPQSGLEAYVRLPKDGNGLPQGVDVRLTARDQGGAQTGYQGIQLGKQ